MRWARMRNADSPVDLGVDFLGARLASPIIAASGTFGHGGELAELGDARQLGAVTTKSVSLKPWKGNASPRVAPMGDGMVNAVGLQNAGIEAWIANDLPKLTALNARVIASIWGHCIEDFTAVAAKLQPVADSLFALEINASCPNLEARSQIFAHDAATLTTLVSGVAAELSTWPNPIPILTKLSPNVTDIRPMVEASMTAGSTGISMINTVMGLKIDPKTRRPVLGKGGGGLSGPPVHAVALRLVWDVHSAFPEVPLLGIGGVSSGDDAMAMMLAGATAVGVGTASFANPRAPWRIRAELETLCCELGVSAVRELTGALIWPS